MLEYYAYQFVLFFNYFVIFYTLVMTVVNTVQFILAARGTATYLKKLRMANYAQYQNSENLIPFSMLIPAYNEEEVIVTNVQALMQVNYVNYEIIVINDGSKDETLAKLIEAFDLRSVTQPINRQLPTEPIRAIYKNPDYPLLTVIDKENGGKSDALNAGINASKYPYFVSLDADSILDGDALTRIAMAFMEHKHTIAVGGIVRVINGSVFKDGSVQRIRLPKNVWAIFQIVEYLRAFLVGRMWLVDFNALMIISGAFGAFKKDVVVESGGYVKTVGEDMEIVLRLHRLMHKKKYDYRISFMPDPVCWTQVPNKLSDLFSQRRRWHVGLRDSIVKNASVFLNPRYGALGMVAMPYYIFFELLGCLVEILGFIAVPLSYFLGILSVEMCLLFLILTIFYGIILSVAALAIEEFTFNKYAKLTDFFLLSLFGILENFFYRQMIMIFRLVGLVFYRRYKESWSSIKRQKIERDTPAEVAEESIAG